MADRGVTRRLAAIMATDVVGFSRMMGEDEAGTLAQLKAVRRELAEPRIAEHDGRIVKLTGDGVLVEFPSVVEATSCAVELQKALLARNADVHEDRRLLFRIGINLGDVIVDGDDIYGDGVNVAARLEAQAPPGGICISAGAFDQVRGKLDLRVKDMGDLTLKNIAEPVHAYRILPGETGGGAARRPRAKAGTGRGRVIAAILAGVAAAGLTVAVFYFTGNRFSEPTASVDGPSIAVLPFDNMSGDPAQDYFSDGMTEDLITDLSQLSGLFVIARNTTFAYKGTPIDVLQVGKDLGVEYVVEGSVRRIGDQVRINAQLIDAATGRHLWAERFDREITDVFALQDDVVRKIVSSLAVRLTGEEQKALTTVEDVEPAAYDALLRGLERFRRFTRETNAESRDFFQQAAAIDPTFARAHADVALSYAMDLAFDWSDDRVETSRMALKHARAAIAIDDSVQQVHFAVANVYLFQKRHDEAIAAVARSVEVDPNYADAYGVLGMIYNFAGEPEKGLEAIRKAMRLNPRYPFFYNYIEGQALYQLGDLEQAIERFDRVRRNNPAFPAAHLFLAAALELSGDHDEAVWAVQEVLTLQPHFTISQLRDWTAYRKPEDLEQFLGALERAGMPR